MGPAKARGNCKEETGAALLSHGVLRGINALK